MAGLHILILGAAGMLGVKLTNRLVQDGSLAGQPISRLTLRDIIAPALPSGAAFAVSAEAADLAADGVAAAVVADRPDIIFHLAAVVSGEAEANFELGYRVNLDGTLRLFEAIRGIADAYCPRVVFTSSLAVYGAPLPDIVADDQALTPLTSYGAQKAIGELLLADYSRRGFLNGIGLRLPTICVRPGRPNKAASGFFSGIIREPLSGQEAILPVGDEVTHWFASPRAAIGFLVHAAGLDTSSLGQRRSFALPGVAASVGDQIDALRRVAGEAVARRIRRSPDPTIAKIIAGWPKAFDPQRALSLGFSTETSFDDIIRIHIEDELGGSFVS
jgi:D-erythronate 2-dehydrogenase